MDSFDLDKPQIPSPEINLVTDGDLKTFVKDMPDVVPDAVKAAENKEEAKKAAWETAQDGKGNKFDPNRHLYDQATGEPLKTPTGRFKRKVNIPPEQKQAQQAQTMAVDPLMLEAGQYVDTINLVARGVIGDEALFQQGERDAHVLAWFKLFQKYGSIEMNPIVGVLVVHAAFIGSRASKPRTQGLLKTIGGGIKNFFGGLYRKVTGQKQKQNTKDDKPKD